VKQVVENGDGIILLRWGYCRGCGNSETVQAHLRFGGIFKKRRRLWRAGAKSGWVSPHYWGNGLIPGSATRHRRIQ